MEDLFNYRDVVQEFPTNFATKELTVCVRSSIANPLQGIRLVSAEFGIGGQAAPGRQSAQLNAAQNVSIRAHATASAASSVA